MSERLKAIETIERLKEKEPHGFMAKMNLALRVIPLIANTPHEELIVECFEHPEHAPADEFREGVKIIREWPTSTDELMRELNWREFSLEQRIEGIEGTKDKPKRKVAPLSPEEQAELDALKKEIETNPRLAGIQQRLRTLKQIQDAYDPTRLPEYRGKLSQVKAALDFIENLMEEGKI